MGVSGGENDQMLPANFRHSSWLEGRALGGEPELEWTFSWNLFRWLKFASFDGLARMYYYEPIHEFDDLLQAVILTSKLVEAGVPEEERYDLGVGFNYFKSAY